MAAATDSVMSGESWGGSQSWISAVGEDLAGQKLDFSRLDSTVAQHYYSWLFQYVSARQYNVVTLRLQHLQWQSIIVKLFAQTSPRRVP